LLSRAHARTTIRLTLSNGSIGLSQSGVDTVSPRLALVDCHAGGINTILGGSIGVGESLVDEALP
jgi:hypothetical protein